MSDSLPRLRSALEELRARVLRSGLVRGVQERAADLRERRAELERVSGQVQQLGARAFQRLLGRWPSLAELVGSTAPRAKRARKSGQAHVPLVNELELELLVLQLVAAPNWQNRASAAAALAQLEGEGAREALIRALRDSSAEVAMAAIDALARRHDRVAHDALRAVLDNRDDYFSPVARVAALSALGRSVSDTELGPIVACLRDRDAEVSIAAIAVVADRKRATAAEQLLPILEDVSGYFLPVVRLAAANALLRAGALTPPLAQSLLDHEQAGAVRRVLERVAQCPPLA